MTMRDATGSKLRGTGPLGATYRVLRIRDLGATGRWSMDPDHWIVQRWDAWRGEWMDHWPLESWPTRAAAWRDLQKVEDDRQEDIRRSVEYHRASAAQHTLQRLTAATQPNPNTEG